jgi:hypothetical protein
LSSLAERGSAMRATSAVQQVAAEGTACDGGIEIDMGCRHDTGSGRPRRAAAGVEAPVLQQAQRQPVGEA